jgi:NAD(P)-dependent dehydrogenase (short-subunit alcohol dehydrogenase family)
MRAGFAEAAERIGKFDILFANAGIVTANRIEETSVASFEQTLATNLTGVFFSVQAALPYFGEQGSIILSGSIAATMGVPGLTAYSVTKAGLRAMTRTLASELSSRRIRVNQVTPGGIATPIWSPYAATAEQFDTLKGLVESAVPMRRIGQPDEVANVALFLASDESSYMTGSEVVVDGGATGCPDALSPWSHVLGFPLPSR